MFDTLRNYFNCKMKLIYFNNNDFICTLLLFLIKVIDSSGQNLKEQAFCFKNQS
jgi:hypothetical protein